MKKHLTFIFLLIFLLLTSCSNSKNFYDKGEYEQAVLYVNSLKKKTQSDYISKGLSLCKLNHVEESKKSILIGQLMSNSENFNEEVSDIFIDFNFCPELTVLALENSTGVKAHIVLYEAYSKTHQREKGVDLLNTKLINELSVTDFATLITNYPVDENYNLSVLVSWFERILEEEKISYIDVLRTFSRSLLENTESISTVLRISQKLLSDLSSDSDLAKIYEIIGNCCINLNDRTNANKYWVASLKLNPENTYIEEQLVKYDR